jgi:hypothetical protein
MAKPKRKVSKGTGQKYQAEPAQQPSTPRPPRQGYPESSLRRRFERYVMSESFRAEAQQAMKRYFEREITSEEEWDEVEDLIAPFFEWFTFDYVLSSGKRVIDLFQAEVGSQLSSTQKGILADWAANKRLRLLEVQEIEPGIKLVAKDLLNDERLELRDVLASEHTPRWIILLARPEWSAGRICLTSEIYPLRPRNRLEILETAQKLWGDYQQQHPQNSLLDFYRQHSLDLILAARRIDEEESIPPTPITEEGHEVCFCSAYFDILSNSEEVAALLTAAEEFEFADSDDDDPNIVNFDWLKRGRSHVAQAEQRPAKSVVLKSTLLTPDGVETEINLGDVSLWEKELWLNTVSVERLEAGKLLLAEILGDHIRHQEGEDELVTWQEKMEPDSDDDDFDEDFDDDFDDNEFEEDDLENDDFDEVFDEEEGDALVNEEEVAQIQAQWFAKHTREWLDESLPALHDLTPRQAAQDSQGRPLVIMLLKDFEFAASENPNIRGGGFDVAFLRQELNITDEDMLA